MLPCGTPEDMGKSDEVTPLMEVHWSLEER